MKKQKAIYLKPMVWEDCGFTCHKKYTGNPPITWIYFLIYFFFYLTKTLFCRFSKFISINMLSQILEWKKNEWNTIDRLKWLFWECRHWWLGGLSIHAYVFANQNTDTFMLMHFKWNKNRKMRNWMSPEMCKWPVAYI